MDNRKKVETLLNKLTEKVTHEYLLKWILDNYMSPYDAAHMLELAEMEISEIQEQKDLEN